MSVTSQEHGLENRLFPIYDNILCACSYAREEYLLLELPAGTFLLRVSRGRYRGIVVANREKFRLYITPIRSNTHQKSLLLQLHQEKLFHTNLTYRSIMRYDMPQRMIPLQLLLPASQKIRYNLQQLDCMRRFPLEAGLGWLGWLNWLCLKAAIRWTLRPSLESDICLIF